MKAWLSRVLKGIEDFAREHIGKLAVAGLLVPLVGVAIDRFLPFLAFALLFFVGIGAFRLASVSSANRGSESSTKTLATIGVLAGVALVVFAAVGLVDILSGSEDLDGAQPTSPTPATGERTTFRPTYVPPTEETQTPILFAENYVGQDIDEVRHALTEAGIRVISSAVLGPPERIGEITEQFPDPGDHISSPAEVRLTFIGEPKRVNLTNDLVIVDGGGFSSCYTWERGTLTLGKNTYRRAWYWTNPYQCSVPPRKVAIAAPSDSAIGKVRAIIGIPTTSTTSSDRAQVTVKVDGKVVKRGKIDNIHPMWIAASDFVRMEVTFRAGPYVPISVGKVWGIKAR